MRFHAPEVSAAEAGDYYQVSFGPKESEDDDPFEPKGPYLLIQQQFEFFNGGRCHIATHDENYVGDFPLKLKEFSPTFLGFEIGRKKNNIVEVSFTLDASEFERVRRVVEIIFGLREPDTADDVL